MKFFILLFIALLSYAQFTFGSENWAHRFPEHANTEFSYADTCQEMKQTDINSLFDFDYISNNDFTGVEIDIVFNKKIEDLVIYHGSRESKGPHQGFSMFLGPICDS